MLLDGNIAQYRVKRPERVVSVDLGSKRHHTKNSINASHIDARKTFIQVITLST